MICHSICLNNLLEACCQGKDESYSLHKQHDLNFEIINQ